MYLLMKCIGHWFTSYYSADNYGLITDEGKFVEPLVVTDDLPFTSTVRELRDGSGYEIGTRRLGNGEEIASKWPKNRHVLIRSLDIEPFKGDFGFGVVDGIWEEPRKALEELLK